MRASAETVVDAPPTACFEILREPSNHPAIVPGLRSIEAEPLDGGGYEGSFRYRFAGIALELAFRDVDVDPPRRRAFEVTGILAGRAVYELAEENGATRLRLTITYDLPGPDLLEAALGGLVGRYVERDAEAWVENAKAVIESGA
ncbi:MAG: SRPBCC family protein [Halobacteriales archaeon]